jgi:hypothetical protein
MLESRASSHDALFWDDALFSYITNPEYTRETRKGSYALLLCRT